MRVCRDARLLVLDDPSVSPWKAGAKEEGWIHARYRREDVAQLGEDDRAARARYLDHVMRGDARVEKPGAGSVPIQRAPRFRDAA